MVRYERRKIGRSYIHMRNISMNMMAKRCISSTQEVRRCASSSQEFVKCRRCTSSYQEVVKRKRCTASSQEVIKRRRCLSRSQEVVKHKRCASNSQEVVKLRRCMANSQEVVLNNEDLLTLILLRVPYTKLMSVKSVSKKWFSLITNPLFTQLLHKLLPSLRATGLFIQGPRKMSDSTPEKVYFIPLDNKNTPSPFRNLTFSHDPYDPEKIRILRSCNGLLLCSTAFFNSHGESYGYVYNPSTDKLDTLPKHPLSLSFNSEVLLIGLTFNPSKSNHYKVIGLATSRSEYPGHFYIYYSETRTWRSSIQSYTPAPGMDFNVSAYWNGCMHWLSELHNNSEPESSVSDCLYFNLDEERLGTFPRPPIGVSSTSRRSLYFGESEDHLHVIELCPYATSLSVYEMKSDYSEWFVKYQIDLVPISKVFPEMTKNKYLSREKSDYAVAVLSLIRRENFKEDSFVVLEIPGKAIRYNLVDRSFKVIWDFSVDFGLTKLERWPFGRFKVWQYVESLP